jgi:hypothetical protein
MGYFKAGITIKFKIRAWLGKTECTSAWRPWTCKISGPGIRLDYALLKLFGEVKLSAELVATFSAGLVRSDSVDFFGERKIGASITVMLGPIPIFIQPAIELGATSKLTASLEGSATSGLSFERRLEAGYQFRGGKWSAISESSGEGLEIIGPEFSSSASVKLELRLVPMPSVTISGLAKIGLSLQPALYANADYKCEYKDGQWRSVTPDCDGVKWSLQYDISISGASRRVWQCRKAFKVRV